MSWFSGGRLAEHMPAVDGMPDLGQGKGWTERDWRRAPVRAVALGRLIGTNRGGYLDPGKVERYRRNGGGGKPYVVEHGGKFYIAEGHHRCVAAIQRGDKTIRAHVLSGGAR